MIWIRADANKEIGMGHVMRCLSVATLLKEKGADVKFILADESAAALLEARGHRYVVLHSDYTDMEAELPVLLDLIEKEQPTVCLIDSYYVSEAYFNSLSKVVKTTYMDDLFRFPYPVDMVINYNIYGDLLPYRETAVKSDMSFLLGTDYVPLRKEFCGLQRCKVRDKAERILITTGGSDNYNLAKKILDVAMADDRIRGLEYHVVSGAFNVNFLALQKMAETNPQIVIHSNVTDMVELMQMCDVAVSAGGSTVYELCAVGVPIICFSFAENQERLVRTFAEKNIVCYGGNYLKEGKDLFEKIAQSLAYLVADRNARENYSRMQQQLVDGRGAERIAQVLLQLS